MTQRFITEVEASETALEAYRLSEYLKKHPDTKTVQDAIYCIKEMKQMNTLFLEALLLSLLGSLRPVAMH
jgi:hypothetical protein